VAADSPLRRPARRRARATPLRRRPKQLDTEPQLLEAPPAAGGSAGGLVMTGPDVVLRWTNFVRHLYQDLMAASSPFLRQPI